jgi:hypothetical protein
MVRQLAAFHSRGQTFLTWKEVRSDASYSIYRSEKSFDGRAPLTTERVGVVRDGSAEFLCEPCGEDYGHGLRRKALLDRSRGGRPLPRDTGLFVWTTAREGRYHYCVIASLRGSRLSSRGHAGVNATVHPVSETPAPPAAVELAATGRAGWYFLMYGDFRSWNRDGVDDLWGGTAWSFHVALPRDAERREKLPVRVVLHGYRAQGVRYDQVPVNKRLVYISAQDWQDSMWWGWAQSIRPAGPAAWPPAGGRQQPEAGPVRPYAARRLSRLIEWVAGGPRNLRSGVDRRRLYLYGHSIGGTGALNFVLSGRPGAASLAGVVATKFPVTWSPGGHWEEALARVWGARKLKLAAEGLGRASAYRTLTPLAMAGRLKGRALAFEPPLLELSLGTADKYAPADRLGELGSALEAARVPYFAHWGNYGHGGGRLSGARNRAFEVRIDEPLLAFAGATCNGRPGKDPAGYLNAQLEWSSEANDFNPALQADDFLETATGCGFSVRLTSGTPAEYLPGNTDARAEVDITPRRLQKFRPKPGAGYAWRALDAGGASAGPARVLASGRVTAGPRGLLTLPRVPVIKRGLGTRVVIAEATRPAEPVKPAKQAEPEEPTDPEKPPEPGPEPKPATPPEAAAPERPDPPKPPSPAEPAAAGKSATPQKPEDEAPKKPPAEESPRKKPDTEDPVDDLLKGGL